MSTAPIQETPLKGLVFPPMPASLARIREELGKESPDLPRVVDIVSSDPSLAAEVLKTINSPAFRRRSPLSSIPSAVMMLGFTKVMNITTAASLRTGFGMEGPWMERFWEMAGDVAMSMAVLAREVSGIPPDTAYTLGLFHDVGIPLLAGRFPDYEATLKSASRDSNRTVTELEHERHGIHHAIVGGYLSHAWHLDPAIIQAIRHHHDYDLLAAPGSDAGEEVVTLVGLLKMAEQVCNAYRGMAFRNVADDYEWERIGGRVLRQFDLTEVQYQDMTDSIIDLLSER